MAGEGYGKQPYYPQNFTLRYKNSYRKFGQVILTMTQNWLINHGLFI